MNQKTATSRNRNQAIYKGAALAITLLVLSGCAPEPTSSTTAQPSQSTTKSSSATPIPTTGATTPALAGEETGFTCDSLLSLQEVFDFNPNYFLSTSSPSSMGNELGKSATSLKGITCEYVSQSDGPAIQISLVKLQGNGIAQVQETVASSSKQTNLYGAEPNISAFFSASGDVGTVNLFIGNYWLSGTSHSFTSAEDAVSILTPIVAKLR